MITGIYLIESRISFSSGGTKVSLDTGNGFVISSNAGVDIGNGNILIAYCLLNGVELGSIDCFHRRSGNCSGFNIADNGAGRTCKGYGVSICSIIFYRIAPLHCGITSNCAGVISGSSQKGDRCKFSRHLHSRSFKGCYGNSICCCGRFGSCRRTRRTAVNFCEAVSFEVGINGILGNVVDNNFAILR